MRGDRRLILFAALLVPVLLSLVWAGPDVIVGDLPTMGNYAASGGIDAFSVATTSCNIGDEVLDWIDDTTAHPVIGQNMYRLEGGRFEQVGMSWLKHGFFALQQELCGDCEANPTGDGLGVGCSDPYSTFLNGLQDGLGPRFEVNATSGEFEYPFFDPPVSGSIARRLQVRVEDLDPDLHEDASYFVEGHYVTFDDAQEGNGLNNASWRKILIEEVTDGAEYAAEIDEDDDTHSEDPAIFAWLDADEEVTIETIDVPDDGRFYVGFKVTELENGLWHYEYAVHNLNSDQSGGSFAIPVSDGLEIINIGFHDVDYHSGEPYDDTDWEAGIEDGELRWSTQSFDDNEDANALRWGTLYNFRFDANAPSDDGDVVIGLFKPGEESVTFTAAVPSTDFLLPPAEVTCEAEDDTVTISWSNEAEYESLEIHRDGVLLVTLDDGDTIAYSDEAVFPGDHQYAIRGFEGERHSAATACELEIPFAIAIDYPGGVPELFSPAGHLLRVSITALDGQQIDEESPAVFHGTGTGFVETSLERVEGDIYEARLPAADCGDSIAWYLSATTTTGTVNNDPPAAPSHTHTALAGNERVFLDHDFEEDQGWSSGAEDDDATTGEWERAEPILSVAQPGEDHSDPGTFCWVTEAGDPGDSAGSHDVDGGRTTLLSPIFDLSDTGFPVISYWRWYDNSSGASPSADEFVVEITDDGEEWVELERVGPDGPDTAGGWAFAEFAVEEFVAATDSVQVRFVASDEGSPSLVEAAIDDFHLEGLLCFGDCNANGIDDEVDLADDPNADCDGNGILDSCDIDADSGRDADDNGVLDDCELPQFVRGDCNADGLLNIADPIKGLRILFLEGGPAPCEDSCDIDNNGALQIGDMILLLNALFAKGRPPEAPYPDCGEDDDDGDADDLVCDESLPGCD